MYVHSIRQVSNSPIGLSPMKSLVYFTGKADTFFAHSWTIYQLPLTVISPPQSQLKLTD